MGGNELRVALAGGAWLLMPVTSCIVSPGTFVCSDDAACPGGQCEATGYCSFPNDECSSGRRYGEFSGPFADECVADIDTESESDSSIDIGTGSTTTGPDSTLSISTTTPASSSTADDTGSGTTVDDDSDPTDADLTGGLLPNGSACRTSDQCSSAACFISGVLGGICGECLGESDCEFGCRLPNPLSDPPTGAFCDDGQRGSACETESSCIEAKAVCAVIIEIPQILSVSTCSECNTTADCETGVCDLTADLTLLGGHRRCVAPGSVPDGEFCDLEGDGDLACEHHCAAANIMSLTEFGVCGECRNSGIAEEGCGFGETCTPPTVGFDGTIVPSSCG